MTAVSAVPPRVALITSLSNTYGPWRRYCESEMLSPDMVMAPLAVIVGVQVCQAAGLKLALILPFVSLCQRMFTEPSAGAVGVVSLKLTLEMGVPSLQ